MTKIYALLSFLCMTTLAEAQFEKGQKVLGGSLGLSASKGKNLVANVANTQFTWISVNPSIGSFSKPNFLRGIGLMYGYTQQKYSSSNNNAANSTKEHSMGLNLFAQRFFVLTQKLFFTISSNASANYKFGKQTTLTNNFVSEAPTSGYAIGVNLAPGISYRLSERLLFDAYLSNLVYLSYSHSKTSYTYIQNGFNLSTSLSNTNLGSVGLGFRWLLKS